MDAVNVQGYDNKAAVDLLRQTGAVVVLRLVRFPPEQAEEPTLQGIGPSSPFSLFFYLFSFSLSFRGCFVILSCVFQVFIGTIWNTFELDWVV